MRYVWLAFLCIVVAAVSILGFRGSLTTKPPLEVFPDMDRQPKFRPQAPSTFFADGRADRPTPPHAVARGRSAEADPAFLAADDHRYRGLVAGGSAANGDWARGFPAGLVVDAEFIRHGQEQFEIFCLPCHGKLGDGQGITKLYGMGATPTYHDDRIRQMPEGEIFNTITNGKNTMFGYGDKIPADDRWAIIAYIRALQRAQQGTIDDVPPAKRSELGL